MDFLDRTVYKGTQFDRTKCLDIKTFQKSQNLYQYLHFTSHHPKSVYKGLIVGECKRYIRTNSCEEQYHSQLLHFKCCLQKRGYPLDFINKYMQTIQYSKRQLLLQRHQPPIKIKTSLVFKCLPPLRHQHLTDIIFETSITSKNP